MALPVSRNTTYAAGSQVKSADLNAIQDELVANHARLSGDAGGAAVVLAHDLTAANVHHTAARTRHLHLSRAQQDAAPGFTTPWLCDSLNLWAMYNDGTGNPPALLKADVEVEEGSTISVSVRLWSSPATANAIDVHLYRYDTVAGSPTTVGSASNAGGSGIETLVLATNHAVVASNFYVVVLQPGSASGTIYRAAFDIIVADKN